VDDGCIRCTECQREADGFVAISERRGYWSDGCGELLSFCAECARREFADHAPASRLVLLVHRPCRRSLIQLRRPLDAEARLTVAGCQARLAKSYALSGAPPPEARRCDS